MHDMHDKVLSCPQMFLTTQLGCMVMSSIIIFQNQYGTCSYSIEVILNSSYIKKLRVIHCIKAHIYMHALRIASYLLVSIIIACSIFIP